MCYSECNCASFYDALSWMALKAHNDFCVKQKKFSHWCAACASQDRLSNYKRPRRVKAG